MIVKNESRVILRLLESTLPIIDSYCICDTGSTDNTIEIIKLFFERHNITGKIVSEPFRDFGYNRSFALKECIGLENADYLLLLDADMVLKINPDFDIQNFKESMTADAYHLFQGSPAFIYKNVRILKNDPNFSYWGVTHEYVKTPQNAIYQDIHNNQIFINDIGDGGSKTEKFERDIRLLKKGLEELPNNDRYTFYLANSYRDSGQYQNAIDTYKKRIEIGGWHEEVWYSYYAIGKCYRDMDDMANAIYYWMEAYNFYPERIENLYEIISYYRIQGKKQFSYMFFELADYQRKLKYSEDHLFLQKDVYDYKIDYEFSIVGYYCNQNNLDVHKSCMRVLSSITADDSIKQNVLNNYKFYAYKLRDFAVKDDNLLALNSIGNSIINSINNYDFVSSTPSVCFDSNSNSNNKLIVNVRYVNYRIGDNGTYNNKDRIITKNIIATFNVDEGQSWKKTSEFELKYETSYDNLYVGLEDIRLFSKNGQLHYNANRGLSYECMVIENGTINLRSQQTLSSLIKKENQRNIEKNWVIFRDSKFENKMIYEWYPLTIGIHRDHPDKILDGENRPVTQLHIEHTINTPSFFKWLRGSTNGINMVNQNDSTNEVWFICHLVSYEDRRHYYHILVVLDATTYELKRYSKLFTFEGEKVEYTLGFVYFENKKQFLIGYSILDRETKYMMIPKTKLDELFL
jgi:tetratricopeptide (TPR) repeat protein